MTVPSFVRGTDAVFPTGIDDVAVFDQRDTRLVGDDSPNHLRAHLPGAAIRRTALPQAEARLALR